VSNTGPLITLEKLQRLIDAGRINRDVYKEVIKTLNFGKGHKQFD